VCWLKVFGQAVNGRQVLPQLISLSVIVKICVMFPQYILHLNIFIIIIIIIIDSTALGGPWHPRKVS
jgi:hypothetical protein